MLARTARQSDDWSSIAFEDAEVPNLRDPSMFLMGRRIVCVGGGRASTAAADQVLDILDLETLTWEAEACESAGAGAGVGPAVLGGLRWAGTRTRASVLCVCVCVCFLVLNFLARRERHSVA